MMGKTALERLAELSPAEFERRRRIACRELEKRTGSRWYCKSKKKDGSG